MQSVRARAQDVYKCMHYTGYAKQKHKSEVEVALKLGHTQTRKYMLVEFALELVVAVQQLPLVSVVYKVQRGSLSQDCWHRNGGSWYLARETMLASDLHTLNAAAEGDFT